MIDGINQKNVTVSNKHKLGASNFSSSATRVNEIRKFSLRCKRTARFISSKKSSRIIGINLATEKMIVFYFTSKRLINFKTIKMF